MVLYGVLRPPREQVGDLAPAVAHSPLRLEDDSVLARHPVALQKEREVRSSVLVIRLYGYTVLRCYGVTVFGVRSQLLLTVTMFISQVHRVLVLEHLHISLLVQHE